MIGLIWAQGNERVIGKDGTIPWRLPEDLAMFKAATFGNPVIMGRKTWESLPPKQRPLPGRANYVLTRDSSYHPAGAAVGNDLNQILKQAAAENPDKIIWVIGGAHVYAQALQYADVLVVTNIDVDISPVDIESADIEPPDIEPDGASNSGNTVGNSSNIGSSAINETAHSSSRANVSGLSYAPEFSFDWRLIAASPDRGWHQSLKEIRYRFSAYANPQNITDGSLNSTQLSRFTAQIAAHFESAASFRRD
ncbi:dihydrofolate reductase [Arcanobacterium hippocoleae]